MKDNSRTIFQRQLCSTESRVAVRFVSLQQFPSVVVTYTLKAMQYGSDAATQQFPRLLQLVELYPETMEAFKKKVRQEAANMIHET